MARSRASFSFGDIGTSVPVARVCSLGISSAARVSPEQVAVVVPTCNSARTLQACLESIRAQQVPCTLVVVDNGSSDSTSAIAHKLADLVIEAGPERSAQRNAGAAATAAEVVGFIDSDMVLPPSVVGQVVAAISMGACSIVVPERTLGEGFWAQVRAYERTFYQGSDAIEAPRFFPRSVFEKAGGFDEAMTGGEDWDLGVRTAGAGPQVRIEATILHDEGRVRYLDACRKKAYYASGLTLFLHKHGARSLAQRSRRPWLRQPRALARPLGLGLLALKTGEITAVAAAIFINRRDRRATLGNVALGESRKGQLS
jgi:glycosyltransferase involved in cell wall biosynthesis